MRSEFPAHNTLARNIIVHSISRRATVYCLLVISLSGTSQLGAASKGSPVTPETSRVAELAAENLCGFIFKSKSPSSGMNGVEVYNARGGLSGRGSGLFAAAFMAPM